MLCHNRQRAADVTPLLSQVVIVRVLDLDDNTGTGGANQFCLDMGAADAAAGSSRNAGVYEQSANRDKN